MQLSANTLFHFTKDKATLLNILKTKFYPRLSLEDNLFFKDEAAAIPMCCFCDIPLSQISDHTSKYGNYAIGIKKDWAISKGVSPVMYMHPKSLAVNNFKNQAKSLRKLQEQNKISNYELYQQLLFMLYNSFFMKPYQKGNGRASIRYYDEREWRYVVPCLDSLDNKTFLSKEEFLDDDKRKGMDAQNENYGVDFTPSVINYIIVESESEILEIKRDLQSIKGSMYPYDDVDLLTTRLISVERIKEDF